jgi:DNA-binding PadR family transcriptional regulator
MSLRYGVLGLLSEQPLHGYQVRSRFEDMLGGAWDVNIGQVYSTLQRLEREGMVRAVGVRGDRGRLVYDLADLGRSELGSWLARPDSGPQQLRQEVYVKLLLAARVANGGLHELLSKQKRAYLQRLRDIASLEERARSEGKDDLALLLRGALLHTEADLKLIDEWTLEEMKRRRADRDD